MKVVLLSDAELRALREVAVAVDHLGVVYTGEGPQPSIRPVIEKVREAGNRPALRRAIQALDNAVRWDRAGRVYFGLTPACARALRVALERTRPMWDSGRRDTVHVRWFLRRLAT